MPTRRKRINELRNRDKNRKVLRPFIILGVFAALVVGFLVFLKLTTRIWSSGHKFSLVIGNKNGDLVIAAFDPAEGQIATVTIPGSTQLQVSRQLGSWRAKSIWRLGENEKLSGELLRETIVRNFNFPVLGWADSGGMGLTEGSFGPLVKSVFSFYKSSLGLGDKIRIALFSLGVGHTRRTEVDLADTPLLRKTRLVDGEVGYLVSGKLTDDLLVIFSEPEVSKMGLKAVIKDFTGRNLVGQAVGATLEVVGVKVAVVEKGDSQNFDCLVLGRDRRLIKEIGTLFSCQTKLTSPEGNYNLEMRLGELFGKRY